MHEPLQDAEARAEQARSRATAAASAALEALAQDSAGRAQICGVSKDEAATGDPSEPKLRGGRLDALVGALLWVCRRRDATAAAAQEDDDAEASDLRKAQMLLDDGADAEGRRARRQARRARRRRRRAAASRLLRAAASALCRVCSTIAAVGHGGGRARTRRGAATRHTHDQQLSRCAAAAGRRSLMRLALPVARGGAGIGGNSANADADVSAASNRGKVHAWVWDERASTLALGALASMAVEAQCAAAMLRDEVGSLAKATDAQLGRIGAPRRVTLACAAWRRHTCDNGNGGGGNSGGGAGIAAGVMHATAELLAALSSHEASTLVLLSAGAADAVAFLLSPAAASAAAASGLDRGSDADTAALTLTAVAATRGQAAQAAANLCWGGQDGDRRSQVRDFGAAAAEREKRHGGARALTRAALLVRAGAAPHIVELCVRSLPSAASHLHAQAGGRHRRGWRRQRGDARLVRWLGLLSSPRRGGVVAAGGLGAVAALINTASGSSYAGAAEEHADPTKRSGAVGGASELLTLEHATRALAHMATAETDMHAATAKAAQKNGGAAAGASDSEDDSEGRIDANNGDDAGAGTGPVRTLRPYTAALAARTALLIVAPKRPKLQATDARDMSLAQPQQQQQQGVALVVVALHSHGPFHRTGAPSPTAEAFAAACAPI